MVLATSWQLAWLQNVCISGFTSVAKVLLVTALQSVLAGVPELPLLQETIKTIAGIIIDINAEVFLMINGLPGICISILLTSNAVLKLPG